MRSFLQSTNHFMLHAQRTFLKRYLQEEGYFPKQGGHCQLLYSSHPQLKVLTSQEKPHTNMSVHHGSIVSYTRPYLGQRIRHLLCGQDPCPAMNATHCAQYILKNGPIHQGGKLPGQFKSRERFFSQANVKVVGNSSIILRHQFWQ